MHLEEQLLLLGHRRQIAGQAVDDNEPDPALLHLVPDAGGKFSRRYLGRIDLLDDKGSILDMAIDIKSERLGPRQKCTDAFVKLEYRAGLTPLARSINILQRDRSLARSGRSGDQDTAATRWSTAQQIVHLCHTAFQNIIEEFGMMIGRDQAWKYVDAAFSNIHVMKPGDEVDAAQFLHLHPASCRTEFKGQTFKRNNTMAQAMEMSIASIA